MGGRPARTLVILKPSPASLLLFLLLVFVSVAGAIQSYAFVDDVPGVEKPPLYDELKAVDAWPAWAMLALPLFLLAGLLQELGLVGIMSCKGPGALLLASIVYSYVLASWAAYSWGLLGRRVKLLLSAIAAALPGAGYIPLLVFAAARASQPLLEAFRATSGWALSFVIALAYLASIAGVMKIMAGPRAKPRQQPRPTSPTRTPRGPGNIS